jgi:hypothetical protein
MRRLTGTIAVTFWRQGFLQRVYEQHESRVLQARVDPDLDSLRSDRRFDELLQRIGPRRTAP